jgi:hypothetical protein
MFIVNKQFGITQIIYDIFFEEMFILGQIKEKD